MSDVDGAALPPSPVAKTGAASGGGAPSGTGPGFDPSLVRGAVVEAYLSPPGDDDRLPPGAARVQINRQFYQLNGPAWLQDDTAKLRLQIQTVGEAGITATVLTRGGVVLDPPPEVRIGPIDPKPAATGPTATAKTGAAAPQAPIDVSLSGGTATANLAALKDSRARLHDALQPIARQVKVEAPPPPPAEPRPFPLRLGSDGATVIDDSRPRRPPPPAPNQSEPRPPDDRAAGNRTEVDRAGVEHTGVDRVAVTPGVAASASDAAAAERLAAERQAAERAAIAQAASGRAEADTAPAATSRESAVALPPVPPIGGGLPPVQPADPAGQQPNPQGGGRPQPGATPPPTTTANLPTASVALSPSLAGVTNGAILNGIVTGAPTPTQVTVQVGANTLVVQGQNLPQSGTLALRVANAAVQPITATLIAAAGQNLNPTRPVNLTLTQVGPQAAPPAGPTGTPPSAVPQPGAPAPSTPTAAPQGPAAPAPQGPVPQQLAPGTILQAVIGTPPGGAPGPGAPGQAGANNLLIQVLGLRGPGEQVPQGQISGGQGAAPVAGAGTGNAGQHLNGVVVGSDKGNLLLRTSAGDLAIQTPVRPAMGTEMTVQVMGNTQTYADAARLAALTTDARIGTLQSLGQSWDTMQQAMQALAAANPMLAAQVQARLPRPSPELAGNLFLFIATMGKGNLRLLLGEDAARHLERDGRGELLRRLGDDFAQMGRLASDSGNADWRAYLVPMADGETLQQVRFFLERERRQERERPGEPGQRFIIDLEFTELGRMQLDGRVIGDQNLFDLDIRTHTELPKADRAAMGTLYRKHMEAVGWGGVLQFHVDEVFPVDPMAEMLGPTAGAMLG